MGSPKKTLDLILRGTSDANVNFNDLRQLLVRLGFVERTKGGHHIFRREGVPALINLQKDGSKAKSYQVKQVRRMLLEYRMTGGLDG